MPRNVYVGKDLEDRLEASDPRCGRAEANRVNQLHGIRRPFMTRTAKPPTLEALEARTLFSTCHVTRLTDLGGGTGFRGDLRYCITKVNNEPGPDSIDFRVTGTINLIGALPSLTSDIDIQGPGLDQLTVQRETGGDYRIF